MIPSWVGPWRIVGYDGVGDMGNSFRLSDRDTTFTDPGTGMTSRLRVNGMVFIEREHLDMSLAVLSGDHAFVDQASRSVEDYSAGGWTFPGLLAERGNNAQFAFAGQMVSANFTSNPDGTVSLAYSNSPRQRYILSRAGALPTHSQVNSVGVVQTLDPSIALRRGVRAALFWDTPRSTAFLEDRGVPLSFMMSWAPFFVVLADPPPAAARARIGTTEHAVAHLGVYEDRNADGRFTANVDIPLAVSPIGLAWTSSTLSPALSTTAFRLLREGYQFVYVNSMLLRLGGRLVPFDPTRVISPDIPIPAGGARPELPDLL